MIRFVSNKDMNVVWHAIDCQKLVPVILNNAGDVFVQFILPFFANEAKTILDSEYELEVDWGLINAVFNITRNPYLLLSQEIFFVVFLIPIH